MWTNEQTKEKVDIVSMAEDFKKVNSVNVGCFRLALSKMTHHQIYQLMWYLQNYPISPLGVEDVTKLMNFLLSHNIHFNIHYKWMKTERMIVRCNVAMFFKWFLPIKAQWYKIMFRLLRIKIRRVYKIG